MTQCNVCQNSISQSVYISSSTISITSLCEIYPQKTEIFFCDFCGHLQTTEIINLQEYYDKTYKILIDTEEEDQLYKVINGEKIFRIDHQVKILLDKVSLPENARVLDYGCAKSATLKKLVETKKDITPHLFDVSEMYIPFWEKFALPENWSTYAIKSEWNDYFDLVTSFFALEHIPELIKVINTIIKLLKPGAIFYCIVPNVYTNIADFVVLDHVNHFSANSLQILLLNAGFESIKIDPDSHAGAFIITAKRAVEDHYYHNIQSSNLENKNINVLREKVNSMISYWQEISEKIITFERDNQEIQEVAIYGSGFYGTFIASCLQDTARLKCFIDQNPYRQGKLLFGKPIIAPNQLSESVKTIYIGLNPQIAYNTIMQVSEWNGRGYNYFYL